MKTRFLNFSILLIALTLAFSSSEVFATGTVVQIKFDEAMGDLLVKHNSLQTDEEEGREYSGSTLFSKCTSEHISGDWKNKLEGKVDTSEVYKAVWRKQYDAVIESLREGITDTGFKEIIFSNGEADQVICASGEKFYKLTEAQCTGTQSSGQSPFIEDNDVTSEFSGFMSAIKATIEESMAQATTLVDKTMECEAMRSLTNYDMNYSDSDLTTPGGEKVSADGQIKCTTAGAETQDYNSCVSAVNAYDAALIGTVGLQTFQEVDFVDKTLDIQADFDSNNPTAGLEAQRDTIQKRADQATERAAFDAAKVGVLLTMWQKMPEQSDVISYCHQAVGRKINGDQVAQYYTDFANSMNSFVSNIAPDYIRRDSSSSETTETAERSTTTTDRAALLERFRTFTSQGGGSEGGASFPVDVSFALEFGSGNGKLKNECEEIVAGKAALLQNQKARDQIKQAMIASGIELTKDALTAKLLNDQANRIDEAIDQVEAFEPIDLEFTPADPLFAEQCQIDPLAEGCDSFGTSRAVGNGGGPTFSFNGAGGVNSVTNPDGSRGENGDVDDDGRSPAARTGGPGKLGGVRDTSGNKNTGGLAGGGGSRASTKGGGSASRGGSGGGSAPSAGGGGGSGAKGGGAAGAKSAGNGKLGKGVKSYDGAIKYRGASVTRSKAKKTDAKNPFSNMFKKGKKKGKGSLRFPASSQIAGKNGSIFQRISKRYNVVQQDENRLLKYDIK